MVEIKENDGTFEEVILTNLPSHQLSNPKYLPTHFILKKINEGRYKGFDKVTYLRKKIK